MVTRRTAGGGFTEHISHHAGTFLQMVPPACKPDLLCPTQPSASGAGNAGTGGTHTIHHHPKCGYASSKGGIENCNRNARNHANFDLYAVLSSGGFRPLYACLYRAWCNSRCPWCGQILKPDVILFGEQLPQAAWSRAQREARRCDLMLVVGSSLEVLPVAGLPMQALDRGAHLIIVNNAPTYINVRADAVFTEDVAVIIPAIVEKVLNG